MDLSFKYFLARKLWKSNLYHRIKIFLWKFGSNSLSTRVALFKRGLSQANSCERCGLGKEYEIHIMFECQFARFTWMLSSSPASFHHHHYSSTEEALETLLALNEESNPKLRVRAAVTMLTLWEDRNQFLFSGTRSDPRVLANSIGPRLGSYVSVTKALCYTKEAHIRSQLRAWSPPPPGSLKLNSDASWSVDGAFAGIIARDHKGTPLLAWTGPVNVASALLKAMDLVLTRRWNDVVFECDNCALISIVNNQNMCEEWSSMAVIDHIISVNYARNDIMFSWVPRSCNSVAHELCQWARTTGFMGFLFPGVFPRRVRECLFSELVL